MCLHKDVTTSSNLQSLRSRKLCKNEIQINDHEMQQICGPKQCLKLALENDLIN